MAEVEQKKQTFHAFTNHGVDLDHVQQDMPYALLHPPEAEPELWPAQNSTCHLRKSKKKAPPTEKPEMAKTYLRDMVVLPEMVGSMLGLYNGKTFNQVETKPEMISHYLDVFTITYKPFEAELCHGPTQLGPATSGESGYLDIRKAQFQANDSQRRHQDGFDPAVILLKSG